MKTKVIIASSLTVLSVAIITSVFVSATPQKYTESNAPVSSNVQSIEKKDEIIVKEVQNQEEPINSQPAATTPALQEAKPINLIERYGWNGLANAESIIEGYAASLPDQFTDKERAFTYIDKVGRAMTDGQDIYSASILYMFDRTFSRTDKSLESWNAIGQKYGISY